MYVYLSVRSSVSLSVCLFGFLFFCLSFCLSVCLSVIFWFVCLFLGFLSLPKMLWKEFLSSSSFNKIARIFLPLTITFHNRKRLRMKHDRTGQQPIFVKTKNRIVNAQAVLSTLITKHGPQPEVETSPLRRLLRNLHSTWCIYLFLFSCVFLNFSLEFEFVTPF